MTAVSAPYETLAAYYDHVMRDVDYDLWAEFLDDVIQLHHPAALRVHELACGTGSMALALDAFGCYTVSGSDRSACMLDIASRKAVAEGSQAVFINMDFTMTPIKDICGSHDVMLCVFDSMNYILAADTLERVIRDVGRCMQPGGIFIFDFTTPLHSIACVEWLDQQADWIGDRIYLHRESRYDASVGRHVNTFRMFDRPRDTWTPDPTETPDIIETHVQRPYEHSDMIRILEAAGVASWTAYREFDLEPADDASERITMVCRW